MSKYKLKYLPLFEQDLLDVVRYISINLSNPEAADDFINKLERAIIKRLENPLAFEAYPSARQRKHSYYRIYVGNYTAFYVVIGDTVEMRRLLYSPRNHTEIINH